MYFVIHVADHPFLFFFNDPTTTEIYTLSLHDALPISCASPHVSWPGRRSRAATSACCRWRSEEHTSELQSRENLVCRLLLEKKKKVTEQFLSNLALVQP